MELVIELPAIRRTERPSLYERYPWLHRLVEFFKTIGALHLAVDTFLLILTVTLAALHVAL